MNEQRIRRELRRLAAREVPEADLWPAIRARLARRDALRRPGTGFARTAGSPERGAPAIESEFTWSERDRPRGAATRWAALLAGAVSLVLVAVLLSGVFGGRKTVAPGATSVSVAIGVGATPSPTAGVTATPTFAATVVPQVLTPPYPTPSTCPVTPFLTSAPFGTNYTTTWLGYGQLFAGLDRAYGGHWYAGGLKVMWMRLQGGTLSITGTRLDGPAPPLKADIPDGYGPAGIQVSEIDFPVSGCWSVTGMAGDSVVSFVVYAYPIGCRDSGWAHDPATPQPCAPPGAISPAPVSVPASCPVTRPPGTAFVPPAPYPAQLGGGDFWYGSESLWALLPASGSLEVVPQDSGAYVAKLLWFHQGYDWQTEPQPPLKVSGHRLDAPEMTLDAIIGSGFSAELHSFMIANLRFPAPGCWQVDADHLGTKLTVVVWVPAPPNIPNSTPELVVPLLLVGLWRARRGTRAATGGRPHKNDAQ